MRIADVRRGNDLHTGSENCRRKTVKREQSGTNNKKKKKKRIKAFIISRERCEGQYVLARYRSFTYYHCYYNNN